VQDLMLSDMSVCDILNCSVLSLGDTRPVRRPRTRWADVVQWDALQLLGIRGWRRRAANRDEWRRLMREVKARKEL
jgi:hypothetical protein